MAHQTDRNGEHNRMQTKFSSHGQTGQFKYHSSVTKAISNIFIPNHVYVLPNKRLTFKMDHAPGVGLGCAGVKNFSM